MRGPGKKSDTAQRALRWQTLALNGDNLCRVQRKEERAWDGVGPMSSCDAVGAARRAENKKALQDVKILQGFFIATKGMELFLMNDNPVKKILLRELSRSDFYKCI